MPRVIAYGSRGLTPSETRYPAYKLEYLALKWAVTDKFKDFLYGNEFVVFTDNNPLKYATSTAKLDATGQRWAAELANYNFQVVYRSGKSNANADALSRLPTRPTETDTASPPAAHMATHQTSTPPAHTQALPSMTIQELRTAQSEEEGIAVVADLVEKRHKPSRRERARLPFPAKRLISQWEKLSFRDGLLVRKALRDGKEVQQLVLPKSLKELAMQELHNKMGHLGPERTQDLLRQRFHWPKMEESVREWCSTCEHCCLRQPARTAHRAP